MSRITIKSVNSGNNFYKQSPIFPFNPLIINGGQMLSGVYTNSRNKMKSTCLIYNINIIYNILINMND